MSSAPLRLAIVGLGKIALDQHLPAVEASSDFALTATVDPVVDGLAGIPHFPTLAQLLASELAIDAVSLCTPPQVRQALAVAALQNNKHLLLEKPPAERRGDLAALLEMAGSSSVFAAWHSRFAGGVGPATEWLAGKQIRAVQISWREDVRVWHPGQRWIFEAGGFGVFDPGINALSIASATLPGRLELDEAALDVPANCAAPIAARLRLTLGGVPVIADFDFLQTGPQTWDIRVETDQGDLVLSRGGSVIEIAGQRTEYRDSEYSALYERFAALIRAGHSDADVEPLRLVEEALRHGKVSRVAEFYE